MRSLYCAIGKIGFFLALDTGGEILLNDMAVEESLIITPAQGEAMSLLIRQM